MAAVCDVFHVSPEHRILRFLWFEENNPSKPIAKFQMTVHLFGNGPSRAVATYGLRKTVKHEEADVKEFVERNSYVDDGLVSTPTADEVITLVKSTEATLTSANLRLHKQVSNSVSVMEAFLKCWILADRQPWSHSQVDQFLHLVQETTWSSTGAKDGRPAPDRAEIGPPFTSVGFDVFGTWVIQSRLSCCCVF